MLSAAEARALMLDFGRVALAAAHPAGRFAGRLPKPPRGRTIVVGAGKAAASMAAAFEDAWQAPVEGLVVTRYGHACPTRAIEVVEAAHPVPDAAGRQAAARIMDLVGSAGPEDLVVALISGGASALLTAPAAGIDFAEKQALTGALLRSGADIRAMNCVRRALSGIKGGRLAALSRAPVVTFLISDVPGDDPVAIGSGPTVPAPDGPDEALAVLDAYGIAITDAMKAAIRANPPPRFKAGPLHMLASGRTVLDAVGSAAREQGLQVLDLGDHIEGEAREVAKVMAGVARSIRAAARPLAPPALILSGGETSVTVRGDGRGGRNAEFLLALALALGPEGAHAFALDTDGIDGMEDNAGAVIDPDTLVRARAAGLDPAARLAANDAYSVFAALGDLVVTGPTLTNVNDVRAILVL
ncbi:glycerate kinase type-2 family protein [Mangrovibrevibacter kandeliae]|uniref:glycerate kinase type-2 family protein n=1 Tax=Mangrovibrevibacter kandeliae TaxID=2968473 RepID=UPI0021185E7B|nr:glycerate kinase [Aurantimonas sp. CSK15Z-1]MCQ8783443.1 glycerate kinase [Aurantimonas sp. CSK15Z-1]